VSNLMDHVWVRNYIERYLEYHNCLFLERGPGHTQVKLSVEVDKDLTNRPYYWTFVERTGTEPETLTMNFIFDQEKVDSNLRGEVVSFGSERLKQFFNAAKSHGKAVRLYQQSTSRNLGYNSRKIPHATKLNPWIGVNYKVELLCDKKKDLLFSLGMNLSNGQLQTAFFPKLKKINLTPVLPANTVTSPPFITFREAALQLEEYLLNEIHNQDFTWAIAAYERLDQEIQQVEAYYVNQQKQSENKSAVFQKQGVVDVEKDKRVAEISWLYSPRIEVKPINYGVFYLDETVLKNVEYLN